MGIKILQNNFTTGAVSPQVRCRVDLAKYEGACKVIRNAIVMAQGGITKRPGTRFVAEEDDGLLIPFTYSQTQTYALLFMDCRVRFFSNGGAVMDGNTVYEIESPYPLSALGELKFAQSADVLYLAHKGFPPMKLCRYGHTDWRFVEVDFAPSIQPPTNLTAKATGFTSTTYLDTVTEYKVASVNADGTESLPCDAVSAKTKSTWQQNARVTLRWTPAAGAVRYEVYKNLHGWFEWAGSTKTPKFVDDNIEPDDSVSPKEYRDPFHAPEIPAFHRVMDVNTATDEYYEVRVSAVNSGGAESAAAAMSPVLTGSSILIGLQDDALLYKIYFKSPDGADEESDAYMPEWGYALDAKDGGLLGFEEYSGSTLEAVYARDTTSDTSKYFAWVKKFTYLNSPPAKLYSKVEKVTPTTQLYTNTSGTKTSRKAKNLYLFFEFPVEDVNPGIPIEATDDVNHYPGAVGIYQQRLMYGGTAVNPQTVWLSETGSFDSMAVSQPIRDDNAITATVDTRQRNEVRHFVSLSDAFVLTDVTEFRMTGKDNVITPGTIGFRPQSYWGSSHVPPVVVGTTILMVDGSGRVVRDVHYNLQEDGYSGDNRSILAEHLLPCPVRDWAYQQNPYSTMYVVREDGKLLTFTYMREQEVWAWAEQDSFDTVYDEEAEKYVPVAAEYRSVCCIREDGKDQVYFLVKRGAKYFVERQMLREWNASSEDSWFVDCGLDMNEEYTVDVVTGLSHLEGEMVYGVADGSFVPPRKVVDGIVSLDRPAKHIILGVAYDMEVITVDPDIKGQDGTRFGSRKTLGPVTFEFLETAGVSAGPDSNHVEVLKIPVEKDWGKPITLYSGKLRSPIPGYARDEASVRFTSDNPFPATVLAVRTEVNVE